MSISGTKSIPFSAGHYHLIFEWTETATDQSANTSTVSWQLYEKADSGYYLNASVLRVWTVNINGKSYTGRKSATVGNGKTTTFASGTEVMAHNSDGTKSFNYAFSYNYSGITTKSGGALKTVAGSGIGTLTELSIASSISVPSSAAFGDTITITLSKLQEGCIDKLYVKYDTLDPVLLSEDASTQSYALTMPSGINLSGKTSVPVTFTVYSYVDDVLQGYRSAVCAAAYTEPVYIISDIVYAVESDCFGELVAGYSKICNCMPTYSPTAKYGIGVAEVSTTILNKTYIGTNFDSDTLPSPGTVSIAMTVTDDRGIQSSKTINVTVYDYQIPQIEDFSAIHCDSDGTADENGDYVKLTYKYDCSPVNGQNTCSMTVQAVNKAGTVTETILSGSDISADTTVVSTVEVSSDYSWTLTMTITDGMGNKATKTYSLISAQVVMDFRADGLGVAFGKTSEEDGIEVNMDVKLEKTVKIGDNTVADFITASGYDETTGWFYQKWSSGICHLWRNIYHESLAITTTVSGSGCYWSANQSLTLPFELTDISASIDTDGLTWGCILTTSGSTLQYRICRTASASAQPVTARFVLFAKWK